MSELITTEIEDRVIIIRMNREDKKNAITGDMYNTMSDALEQLESNAELHAGLITGSQNCFTAGNDLVDFLNSSGLEGETPVGRFLRCLTQLSKPLVAAVNGPAIGIGTTLLLHCDLVYSAPGSKFQMPFVNLALCPEAGSSLLLQQLVGYRQASELLLLCELFGAEQAKDMGIINEIIDVENYQAYALKKAKQLAAQPPRSVQTTKKLLRKGNEDALKAIMELEIQNFTELLNGAEAKEAFSAFLEKRKPDFSKLS